MNSELDNLKNGWKAFKEISENEPLPTKNQLEEILKKDSKQIGHSFKKLLWKETILSTLFMIFFAILSFTTQNNSPLLWSIMLVIYIASTLWLINRLYKFPTQNKIELNLYTSLEQQIKVAKEFITVYTKANIILAAPSTLIGFLAGIQFTKDKSLPVYFGELIQNESYGKLSIFISVGIILAFGVTYSIKELIAWRVKNTYGKYLEQLEALSLQLKE